MKSKKFKKMNHQKVLSVDQIEERIKKRMQNPQSQNNIIELKNYKYSLVEAMLRPDIGRAITFPIGINSGPSTQKHVRDTMFIQTNYNGCAWVEVNFGQFLDEGIVANGVNNTNNAGNLPRSNVFYYYNPSQATNPPVSLDGQTQLAPGTTSLNGSGDNVFVFPSTIMEDINLYNAVRCGPESVTWDFTGRIDTSQGMATMGINYTNVTDTGFNANNTNAPNITFVDPNTNSTNPNLSKSNYNGYLPDYTYTTLKTIENCAISKTVPVTENLTGIFIPHDYGVLNYRGNTVGYNGIQQRLFFMVVEGPPNQNIGKLNIMMNWDGKPNSKYADQAVNNIGIYAKTEDLTLAINMLIEKNKVIFSNQNDNQWGVGRLFKT